MKDNPPVVRRLGLKIALCHLGIGIFGAFSVICGYKLDSLSLYPLLLVIAYVLIIVLLGINGFLLYIDSKNGGPRLRNRLLTASSLVLALFFLVLTLAVAS